MLEAGVPTQSGDCSDDSFCRAWLRSTDCVILESADGGTATSFSNGSPSEETARTVWQAIDPLGYSLLDGGLEARAEHVLLEEERAFVPRFAPTFGLFGAYQSNDVFGLGAKGGVRRWHDIHVLTSYEVQYEYSNNRRPHGVALIATLELSRWSRFSDDVLGAPWASVGLLVGPQLQIGSTVATNLRAGVVVHVNELSGLFPIPFFIELTAVTELGNPSTPLPALRGVFGFGL